MPFSDPLADGPTIQRSTFEALQQGMTLAGTLELIERAELRPAGRGLQLPQSDSSLRGRSLSCATPTRWASPACSSPTCRRAAIRPSNRAVQASTLDLIRLIAPTTRPDRLAAAVEGAQGFVYLVARLGVTGASRVAGRRSGRLDRAGARGRPRCRSPSDSASPPPEQARDRRAAWPTAWWSAARWWTPSARDGVPRASAASCASSGPGSTRPRRWPEHGPSAAAARRATPGCCRWAALVLTAAALAVDPRWLDQPVATLILMPASSAPAGGPGPAQQVLLPDPDPACRRWSGAVDRRVRRRWSLALWLGVLGCRRRLAPEAAPGGRHQRGPRSPRLRRGLRALRRGARPQRRTRALARSPAGRGDPRRACTSSPTRALFYFTLLVRDKLEHAEKILILRWEIISYLLTLIAAVVVVAALRDALAGRLGGGGAGPGRARAAHPPDPGGGDRRRGPEQGAPDGGGDREQRHAAGLLRPDRAAGLPAARLGRLPDLPACSRRRARAGLPRRARAGPIAATPPEELVAAPAGGHRQRRAGLGARRPARSARRAAPMPEVREPGHPSDPVRRRPARHRRGGPPQAPRLRGQGSRRRSARWPTRSPPRSTSPSSAVRCSARSSRSASRSRRWRG